MEAKQELVHFNNTKVCFELLPRAFCYLYSLEQIKVKCRRLSSGSESGKTKEPSIGGSGMKLTIKTKLSGCRKPNSTREPSPVLNKKKTAGRATPSVKPQKGYGGDWLDQRVFARAYFSPASEDIPVKHEELPKISYTLGKADQQNRTSVECCI